MFSSFLAYITAALTSGWALAVNFLLGIFSSFQAYVWTALVLLGIAMGFQIGGWWYYSDCKDEGVDGYKVGYDLGYSTGYDHAKAGKRKLMYPSIWAPPYAPAPDGIFWDTSTDEKVKAYFDHMDKCEECHEIGEDGYPKALCSEGERLLNEIFKE